MPDCRGLWITEINPSSDLQIGAPIPAWRMRVCLGLAGTTPCSLSGLLFQQQNMSGTSRTNILGSWWPQLCTHQTPYP